MISVQPSRGILKLLETLRVTVNLRDVKAGDVIARAGNPIDELFVPSEAIFLIARHTALDPVPLTVGMVGYEGLIGWPALLATDRWTHDAVAICGGSVAIIDKEDMLKMCAQNNALNRILLRVAYNHTVQMAQSVVANLGHSLERRLARWLLMLDDRTFGDTITITHADLGTILNVRRASITDAIHILEGENLLSNRRGKITILNRDQMKFRAGQSYGLSENDYSQNIGPFGK